jgi:hypothetical protein
MESTQNVCKCPNTKCKRHGNCEACKKSHRNTTMYCELRDGSIQKRLMNFFFRNKKG